jgi:hypothetical protein
MMLAVLEPVVSFAVTELPLASVTVTVLTAGAAPNALFDACFCEAQFQSRLSQVRFIADPDSQVPFGKIGHAISFSVPQKGWQAVEKIDCSAWCLSR